MLHADRCTTCNSAAHEQIGTPTVYAGLTLAGVLATSAHGSGYQDKSGIWDTLLEITWVDGTGKVCDLSHSLSFINS